MLVGRRYRLQFTPEQREAAEEYGSICRAVWNIGLEQRREYRRRGAWINYVQQAREMAEAKVEHPWLRTAPSHILQRTLRDLDRACRTHGTFGVRWRAKQRWQPSFRFPDPRHLSAPVLRQELHHPWRGPAIPETSATARSHPEGIEPPKSVSREDAGHHAKVRDRRRDFHAQTARHVVDGNGLVVLEDLNTVGMTATARGASAEPGTHVGQKAGLNRAILDKGWHSFELAVRNRARHTGTAVLTVNPAFSSTTCPVCGCVHPDNRESQARFVCTACGHREHTDTIGAKNVLARGHTGHRAWRPRRQPVCEAKPQGISAPTSEVGIPSASTAGRIAKSVMWDVTRVSLHET
ncbi:RNA-guided endonuclease InsQ/TnpB family protein [Streptomyces coeruleorubidus]|uniref:RNA-guided endonuclease InsQ/TnpB family protein n=1 Tax=Streptomyces coeruleorubidus TaxID=116188 RepID=UPI0033C25555